jgi:hypothetical protein
VILAGLGLPHKQQNKISGLTLLALCRMSSKSEWKDARRESVTIRKGIMDWVRDEFGVAYAENSRESFRRQVVHQFVQAGVALRNPDDPTLPTNSSLNHYSISDEALAAIRMFGTTQWEAARDKFVETAGSLAQKYAAAREHEMVPLTLPDGTKLQLSPGEHNVVQAAIVNEFAPRFAPGARLLYLGDTAEKALIVDTAGLRDAGLPITEHDKLPDVVLHDTKRGWLFLVEAVTSHGPMSPKRIHELKAVFGKAAGGLIFVSAFPHIREFKKHAEDIAWDTEVWLADLPDHMLHFNGDRFLGPR